MAEKDRRSLSPDSLAYLRAAHRIGAWSLEKHTTVKMTDDELAGLEEEIRSARDHLEGALCMIVDPYARGKLAQHLDYLVHSANKWLDHNIAVNGTAPSAAVTAEAESESGVILGANRELAVKPTRTE